MVFKLFKEVLMCRSVIISILNPRFLVYSYVRYLSVYLDPLSLFPSVILTRFVPVKEEEWSVPSLYGGRGPHYRSYSPSPFAFRVYVQGGILCTRVENSKRDSR